MRTGRVDHPRVCGEQKLAFVRKQENGGSPPRVRGTVIAVDLGLLESRITPACAGNRDISRVDDQKI